MIPAHNYHSSVAETDHNHLWKKERNQRVNGKVYNSEELSNFFSDIPLIKYCPMVYKDITLIKMTSTILKSQRESKLDDHHRTKIMSAFPIHAFSSGSTPTEIWPPLLSQLFPPQTSTGRPISIINIPSNHLIHKQELDTFGDLNKLDIVFAFIFR